MKFYSPPPLSVPLSQEHMSALNAFVFHRVSVEEAGLVPAVLEWVKAEVQLGTAQRRYDTVKSDVISYHFK